MVFPLVLSRASLHARLLTSRREVWVVYARELYLPWATPNGELPRAVQATTP